MARAAVHKTKADKPKAIDLFSGAGGLTSGLRKAGFQVIAAVEVDPVAAETYASNHKGVWIWKDDICKLTAEKLCEQVGIRPGELDLLAGCPPCQGFSSIRTLNGAREIDDPRNDLIGQFIKFAKVLQPKAIMLENVPGLAKDQRFDRFCKELEALGYPVHGAYMIVNAAEHGVPQRRRRLIMMTSKYGLVPFPKPALRTKSVRDAIGKLPAPGASGDPLHDLPDSRSNAVVELIKAIPKDGGSRRDLGEENQLDCHKKCAGFRDVYGRMAWDKVSPTITSGCNNPSKGRFIHPEQDRAITLREAALLQTFPHNYKFSLKRGKTGVSLMIGNALPPELIRRHASMVIKLISTSGSSRENPLEDALPEQTFSSKSDMER